MKLDLLFEIDAPMPWEKPHPYGQREREQRAYFEAIEQVKLADELGFNTAWFVEHHFREGRSHCSAPEVLIGALSQITKNIRLGFGVTLLPHGFGPPVRVAEKVATADLLSRGRVEWGIGRSTPMEQIAFGVDAKNSREQMFAAAEAIVQMWEQERFSCDSKWLKFPERMVTPKPYQDPHPPAWMAAVSDDSAELAGKMGLGLLSLSLLRPVDDLADAIRRYRKAAEDPDKPLTSVTQNRAAAYTLVHCAETMEQAEKNKIWDSVWWWYSNLAEFTLKWEFEHFDDEIKEKYFPIMFAQSRGEFDVRDFDMADMIIVGDTERVIEKMKRYADIGIDELLCFVQFGYNSHESCMRTIELLGKEVLPELENYQPQKPAKTASG